MQSTRIWYFRTQEGIMISWVILIEDCGCAERLICLVSLAIISADTLRFIHLICNAVSFCVIVTQCAFFHFILILHSFVIVKWMSTTTMAYPGCIDSCISRNVWYVPKWSSLTKVEANSIFKDFKLKQWIILLNVCSHVGKDKNSG